MRNTMKGRGVEYVNCKGDPTKQSSELAGCNMPDYTRRDMTSPDHAIAPSASRRNAMQYIGSHKNKTIECLCVCVCIV